MTAPLVVTLRAVTDWEALGAQWRAFETRADGSFFQSWSWIGCLASERYDDPLLLEAQLDGRTVALGLFNRRRGWLFDTLWLHETGDPKRDAVFIEHNGLLIDAQAGAGPHRHQDRAVSGESSGSAYRSLPVMAGLDPAIPNGTDRDNGATDRGYGSCGDGRVRPGHDGERASASPTPYPDAHGARPGVDAATQPDAEDALRATCLAAARHAALPAPRFGRRLILSGVDPAHLGAAAMVGAVSRLTTRVAPRLDLAALRRDGHRHLDVLSANTRAQLRRSLRAYATLGKLAIMRAADTTEAHRFLDELAKLHQLTWQHRGRPGAFAEPHFARFHHALIDRALPRGEVALWRVTAGAAEIGYLYNFQHRGHVLAYQSGFDYAVGGHHAKPGLTCHHLAIERGLAEGMTCYDFLAGDDRYKRSLSSSAPTLHWLTVGPRFDPVRLADRVRAMVPTAILPPAAESIDARRRPVMAGEGRPSTT